MSFGKAIRKLGNTLFYHRVHSDGLCCLTLRGKIQRKIKYWWQRKTRGFDDSQTWSLDMIISKFVLPRLKRFKELNNGHPAEFSWEEWNKVLENMIYAMEVCSDEDKAFDLDDNVDWPRVNAGLINFGTHFRDLWW